jgi:hypothetical protein
VYAEIEESFYILAQNENVYAEIVLDGDFGTEEAGATTANFTT